MNRFLIADDLAHLGTNETPDDMSALWDRSCSALRLLVLNADHASAKSLATHLRKHEHEVTVVTSQTAALEALRTFWPHLMFLTTPDGDAFARHVRACWHSCHVVLVGIAEDGQKSGPDEAVFDHLLTKPVKPTEIQNLLASVNERSILTGDVR